MKKQIVALVTLTLAVSLACQMFVPPTEREGMVISDCADIVRAVSEIQPGEVPQNLMDTGIKTGDEFDANDYFKALNHISMQEGYALDYVYQTDFLGSLPIPYARPVEQEPYASMADVPDGQKLESYRDHIEIEDVEQGYFEYVVLDTMVRQFYLVWHANYNDAQIVCDRAAADEIVEQTNSGGVGTEMDAKQKAQVRAMTNIEPAVKLTADSAIVEVVIFTKWGGFFRQTYTISRSFPHTIQMDEENIVEYDCGIMF